MGLRTRLWRAMELALKAGAEPRVLLRRLLASSRSAPFELKLKYDAMPRPEYAYGLFHAASQARALDYPAITALELGVGPGDGLAALEAAAGEVERLVGIRIDVIGMDTGRGLPPPEDYRDLPYCWAEGDFWIPPERIRARLKRAELVLGNVRETAPALLRRESLAPIGFISFDLDYYSSTRDAMVLIEAPPRLLLPRVFCYMDDAIGTDRELHCDHVGELLAIREFNDAHAARKVCPIHGLARKREVPALWNDLMHVLHAFDHPFYTHRVVDWRVNFEGARGRLGEREESERAFRREWLGARAPRPAEVRVGPGARSVPAHDPVGRQ